MKLIVIIVLCVAILFLSSCSKTDHLCDAGKVAAKVLSVPVSKRWECNQDKVSIFFESEVKKYTCSDANTATATDTASSTKAVSIQQVLCPVVIGSLVSLGADKLVSEMGCNKEKIVSDLSGTTKLCDLFNQTN